MTDENQLRHDLARLIGFECVGPLHLIHRDAIIFFVSEDVRIMIGGFELLAHKENMLPFLCMKAAIARLQLRGLV